MKRKELNLQEMDLQKLNSEELVTVEGGSVIALLALVATMSYWAGAAARNLGF